MFNLNWTAIVFIISSTIGSSVFILPYLISGVGINAIFSIGLTSIYFISTGLMIAQNKNIFTLVKESFGKFSFFISWLYWLISWISTIIVINEIFIYLHFLPHIAIIKICLVLFLIFINLFGIKNSSRIEMLVTIVKIIPVLFILLYSLKLPTNPILHNLNLGKTFKLIPACAWGFVGIECGSIISEQSKKSIITETVLGVSFVSFIYIFSVLIFLFKQQSISSTPYVDLCLTLFGPYGKIAILTTILLVCLGTINTWVMSSGYTAYNNAKEKIFPKFFLKTNRFGSPYVAILISSIFLLPLCLLQNNPYLLKFVDLCSNGFIFFYGLLWLASLIHYIKQKKSLWSLLGHLIMIFVSFGLFFYNGETLYTFLLLFLGIPFFVYTKKIQ